VLFRFFFLGAFAKLQKAAVNFIMSVCPFVRLSAWNLVPTGRIFMKFDICVFFENFRENVSFIKIGREQRLLYMTTNMHI